MSTPPPIHPQVIALLAEQGAEADADGPPDLVCMRAGYLEAALRLGGAREEVAEVQDVVAGGPNARAYRPVAACEPLGVIVWCHGGGWIMGDLEGFEHVCRALANAAGHVVVSVDYRLAPEHPYPAALDDALAAVAWALGHGSQQLGYDADRVIVGGDSAGGNLAAVAARHHLERLAGQLLVYPVVDAEMRTQSYREAAGADVGGLTPGTMERCFGDYLQAGDITDPDVSPLRGELSGLPPALVAVAEHDVLRDDGLAYAKALAAAGVAVELLRFDDMVHGFLRWGGVVDRAAELIGAMGSWSRTRLA
ncbi:MAG: alpha/beta hydrolase [Actinomycetota bacterium]|nr:alpha/beta hydrolase [Actinomycetota bacterium]